MPIGYQFPFQQSTGSLGLMQMTSTELDAIKSNLKVLLLTNWGERPMSYDFGCNLREFLFEQLGNEETSAKIADRIMQQVNKWMPFLTLTNLNILFEQDDPAIPSNAMLIKISFILNRKTTGTVTQLIVP